MHSLQVSFLGALSKLSVFFENVISFIYYCKMRLYADDADLYVYMYVLLFCNALQEVILPSHFGTLAVPVFYSVLKFVTGV